MTLRLGQYGTLSTARVVFVDIFSAFYSLEELRKRRILTKTIRPTNASRGVTLLSIAAGYQALSTMNLPFRILPFNLLFDLLNRAPARLGSRDGENIFSVHSLWCMCSPFAGLLVHKCEVKRSVDETVKV